MSEQVAVQYALLIGIFAGATIGAIVAVIEVYVIRGLAARRRVRK